MIATKFGLVPGRRVAVDLRGRCQQEPCACAAGEFERVLGADGSGHQCLDRELDVVNRRRGRREVQDMCEGGLDRYLGGDARLHLKRVEYRSRARATNRGLLECTAPFVCSVDADVRFLEDRFDELLKLADSVPFLMPSDDGHDNGVVPVRLNEEEFRAPRNAFLFSRGALPELGFAEIYPAAGGEDTDLALRLLKAGVGVGVTRGGYEHDRVVGAMRWRRRAHFHLWNLITYSRHLDVPMVRRRLLSIARHPVRRAAASVRQELGRNLHSNTVR